MDQIKTGQFLKKLRNEKGLTQERLAEHFNVSGRTVSRWETGSNMPDLALLAEIADYYQVDLREIINGERKSEDRDSTVKETLLLAAEYADSEKHLLLRRVRWISIIGAVTMIVGWLMAFPGGDDPVPVYSYLEGVCYGVSFGAIVCSIFYTSGILTRLQQKKKTAATKVVLALCLAVCGILFAVALALSLR